MGSSPRVWGQETAPVVAQPEERIIPTRVGTSLWSFLTCFSPAGSSPRVWGQALTVSNILCLARIIPTRVGTSGEVYKNNDYTGDHPHACGDKRSHYRRNFYGRGSSPRVWGQGASVFLFPMCFRIIPTRVGTRSKQNS